MRVVPNVVAVDMGGTHTRVARYVDGKVGPIHRFPTPSDYLSACEQLISAIQSISNDNLGAVGISIAGSTDGGETITFASNLPAFVGKPLAKHVRNALGVPVALTNDGRAMAASEYAEREHGLVYVIMGTGVNFCVALGPGVFDPLSSVSALVGEGGHIMVERDNPRRCGCGKHGCLEAYVSGSAIFDRFGPIEGLAGQGWDEIATYLVRGLHPVAQFTGGLPMYFGGGAGYRMTDQQIQDLQDRLTAVASLSEPPQLGRGTHEESGLYGAAIMAQQAAANR